MNKHEHSLLPFQFCNFIEDLGIASLSADRKKIFSVPSSPTAATFPPHQHHSKGNGKSFQEWIVDRVDKQNYSLPSHFLNAKIFRKNILNRITFLFFFFPCDLNIQCLFVKKKKNHYYCQHAYLLLSVIKLFWQHVYHFLLLRLVYALRQTLEETKSMLTET